MITKIKNGLKWRCDYFRARILPRIIGAEGVNWSRVVMNRAVDEFLATLPCGELSALEVSGSRRSSYGFKSYRKAEFPEFDICKAPLDEQFDLIFVEQVFEHLEFPYRAAKNLKAMLKPDGIAIVSTPFLVRIHNRPVDCSRWSELGLKNLFVEAGFGPQKISTGSWGNRACIRANSKDEERWVPYVPWRHSLKNEPDFPVTVWAFVRNE